MITRIRNLLVSYPELWEIIFLLLALVMIWASVQLFFYIDQAAASEVGHLNGRAVINLTRLK